jgi:hypothetical protein
VFAAALVAAASVAVTRVFAAMRYGTQTKTPTSRAERVKFFCSGAKTIGAAAAFLKLFSMDESRKTSTRLTL